MDEATGVAEVGAALVVIVRVEVVGPAGRTGRPEAAEVLSKVPIWCC